MAATKNSPERVRKQSSPSRRDSLRRPTLRTSVNGHVTTELAHNMRHLLVSQDQAFTNALNERTDHQQQRHTQALDEALAKHQAVQDSAKKEFERFMLELQRLHLEQQARKSRELEEQSRRKAEAEAQAAQQRLAAERAEDQRKAQAAKLQQEEATRRAQAEQKKKEEQAALEQAERKRRQEAEAAEKAKAQQELEKQKTSGLTNGHVQTPASPVTVNKAAAPTTTATPASTNGVAAPAGLVSSSREREDIHQKYLALHQRLKQMRAHVLGVCKQAGLKNQISDMRRSIQKSLSQVSKADKMKNLKVAKDICAILDAGVQTQGPTLDVAQCMLDPTSIQGSSTQGSAFLIYLLNAVSKCAIKQLISEAAVDHALADPVGVVLLTIFADPRYQFNGLSFIDMLWAKYHFRCPILFGINGNPNSSAGRKRLGWYATEGGTQFVPLSRHLDDSKGLAVGFAACTLRDFSKSKKTNPVPNRMYWEAVARVVNTPPSQQHVTHYVILSSLLDQTMIPRFISFFGGAALAAMRKAFVDFPKAAPEYMLKENKAYVTGLQHMPLILAKDMHLVL